MDKIKDLEVFKRVIDVVGLCLNASDLSIRGCRFKDDYIISKGYVERKKGTKGDKNFCMKTEIMKQYLIPELEDTKWVPEGIIWNRIDRDYDTVFVNIPFSVCTEANADSMLGSMKLKGKNRSVSASMSVYYASIYAINESADIMSAKQYVISFINLWSSFFSCSKLKIRRVFNDIAGKHKTSLLLSFFPSYVYYVFKNVRSRQGESLCRNLQVKSY